MPNPVGKPLRYKTIESLQSAINYYFNECDNRTKIFYDKEGTGVEGTIPEPYTMAGLAYAVGLSRQALMEYSHRDGYGDAIKEARQKIERDVERRLMETTNQAGAIFNLKNNFGWRDKTETDITTQGEKIGNYDASTAAEFSEYLKSKTKE